MDYLQDPKGRATDNPDLHYMLIHWFIETYGEEWWWAHTDWWMNYAIVGDKPQKLLAISFDNKQHYSTVTPTLGVFDYSVNNPVQDPVLLLPLNVADPNFFAELKKLVDEFTPSTTPSG